MKNVRTHNTYPTIDVNMTHLQGYVTTTYEELVRLFGEPLKGEPGDKVQAEWLIESKGLVATIYDWKRYGKDPQTNTHWHVGGRSVAALKLIEKCLSYPE